MATQQTFEESVQEFIDKSRELIDKESDENLPLWSPSPFDQSGPPYEYSRRFDSQFISRYARTIAEGNPLFTDRDYGKRTRYGSQLAPGPILALVRYPSVHGATRPGGYPLANFISGAAWEFYDVVRTGSKFRSTKVTKEIFEKPGSRGNLVFMISNNHYWDFHEDLVAKCYGTQIYVPIEAMGTGRAMSVERLGEHMMYERKAQQYNREEIENIVVDMENARRRGAETLYWEDVEVGEKIGPLVLPPWTLLDQVVYHSVAWSTTGGQDNAGDVLAFEPLYHYVKTGAIFGAITHPMTRWPWTMNTEHEDALLAAFRGQPGPFDFGVQRSQIPQQLMSNWMGDEGFIRRLQMAFRKPVYYADTTVYTGEVVKKYKEVQQGESGSGAKPGKVEYNAVGIKYQGLNQVGEAQVIGTSTVYLPSRESGPVQLPIPHPADPPFVPYETFYRDWY